MKRIFDDAKDKNVAATIIYGKSGEAKPAAYVDEAYTTKFKTSELEEAFLKRAVVKIGADYFVPTGFSIASKIGKITYTAITGSGETEKVVLNSLAAVAD